jgi:MFS family permease
LRRNKPLALVGYALGALAKPAIGLATAWPAVLVGRFADRLGTGIRSAPRDALIAGSVDESRRGAAFGLEGVGDNLGAVVGPLLAAGLLFALHVEMRSIFFLAFVPGALALVLIAFVSEPRGREPGPPASRTASGSATCRRPTGGTCSAWWRSGWATRATRSSS